jgi:hypothetical protein
MAHYFGDKTQEYAKVWRRHTDPPGLWFAIAIVSLALHLLLFWLMRSYSFSLSRQNQNPIPVEIIEVSSPRQLRAKPKPKIRTTVLPKPVRQKSLVAPLPKQIQKNNLTLKPAINQDRKALAYPSRTEEKRSPSIAFAQQRQQKLAQQRQQQLIEQQRQQQLLSQLAEQQRREQQRRQQELAEQQQLAEQQRREQELAEQELAEQQQLAEQQRREQQQLAEQELAEQQRREQELAEQKRQQELDDQKNAGPLDAPRTGTGDAPRTQNSGTAKTPPNLGVGLSATWSLSTQEELAINTRGDLPTILKDIELPKLAEAPGQESNSITIPATFKLQPGKFIFSLVIEDNGKCSQVLLQDKNMPSTDKKIYEQFGFEEICQKQRFVPAYKLSDRTPLTSNLYVTITIEQKAP